MNGRPWKARELALLRRLYAETPDAELQRRLKRSRCSIYNAAHLQGLRKSKAYMARELARLGRQLTISGRAHHFPKGHVPLNKGMRRPGWYAGRMRETQFKKGQWPINKDPGFYVLGALRVNADGYIDMRVSFAAGARGWRGLHQIIWEDVNGPVPAGHVVRFKDRDRDNVVLDNLELLSRRENCLRNSIHNLPQPLVTTIQLLGALKRTLNRREREKHRGPARAPV